MRLRVELLLCRLQLKTRYKGINICWNLILCSETTFLRICTFIFLSLWPLKEVTSCTFHITVPDFREKITQLVPPGNEERSSPSIVQNNSRKKGNWLSMKIKSQGTSTTRALRSSLQFSKMKNYAIRWFGEEKRKWRGKVIFNHLRWI